MFRFENSAKKDWLAICWVSFEDSLTKNYFMCYFARTYEFNTTHYNADILHYRNYLWKRQAYDKFFGVILDEEI